MLLGRPPGDGLAVGLESGQHDGARFGGEAGGEAEGPFEVDPMAQVAPTMGPAPALVVVGGRGPDPGRGPLQLGPGPRLGQRQ
jgi:hypothetical protein